MSRCDLAWRHCLLHLAVGIFVFLLLGIVLSGTRVQAEITFLDAWTASLPEGVAVGATGDVYVAEKMNHRIRKFDHTGTSLSVFGVYGTGDGQFRRPEAVAVSAMGQIYVADANNHRIQSFDESETFLFSWGSSGNQDGEFDLPGDVAIGPTGTICVADTGNHRIQMFDGSGAFISTWGRNGDKNGELSSPSGAVVGATEDVYVADSGNDRIQKFHESGSLLVKWGTEGTGDGQFDNPLGIALDASGNVFVADSGNNRIQKFDGDGEFLAKFGSAGTGSGQFMSPRDLAVRPTGEIYVADYSNSRIQRWFDSDAWVSGANQFMDAGIGSGQLLGSDLVLDADKTLTVTNTITVHSGGSLRIRGGQLTTGTLALDGYATTFEPISGTVAITALTLTNQATLKLPTGQNLGVSGATSIGTNSVLVLDGGRFSAGGGMINDGEIQLDGSTVELLSPLTNNGLVVGSGRLTTSPLANAASGQVRASDADRLVFTGSGNTNGGAITLLGGTVEFTQDLQNIAGGFIAGRGTLIADGGMSNTGVLAFSSTADVFGDVVNNATGQIVVAGGGTTTFFDDVTNHGSIQVSAGSNLVFFGSYNGGTTGTGTVHYFGDLRPGNSPAAVEFGGDLNMSATATTYIELGGLEAGTEHDQVNAHGRIALKGTLDVALIDIGSGAFAPQQGDHFAILTGAGGINGAFDTERFPAIAPGLWWAVDYGSNAVTLDVIPVDPGDMNGDSEVDFDDISGFVLAMTNPVGYEDRFGLPAHVRGDTDADGDLDFDDIPGFVAFLSRASAADTAARVPEPSTLAAAIAGGLAWLLGAGSRTRARQRAKLP